MPYISVWIHFVWTTKDREPLLTQSIRYKIFEHIRANASAKNIFIGALNGRHLRRVHFSQSDPNHIEITEHLFDGQFGRISDAVVGPDGALYFCTSNAGTTTVEAEDDRLIRLTNGS